MDWRDSKRVEHKKTKVESAPKSPFKNAKNILIFRNLKVCLKRHNPNS